MSPKSKWKLMFNIKVYTLKVKCRILQRLGTAIAYQWILYISSKLLSPLMWARHQVTKFLWHGLGHRAENTRQHYRKMGRNLAGIFDMDQELGILQKQLLRLEIGFIELLNILKNSCHFKKK